MKQKSRALAACLVGGLVAVTVGWTLSAGERPAGHWPQWRGPDRNSVSKETGLLESWPEGGPPLAWSFTGLGDGVASVAVAAGRVFTLGRRDGDEHLTALDEATGKKLWSVPVGPAMKGESSLMRWLSPRTPTVDEDRVYAVTARAELACFRTTDGTLLWRANYVTDFQGRIGGFGCGDRPLVDGELLICTPGGKDSGVVALDKKTGKVVWRCAVPGAPGPSYCATTVADVGGIRHYVAFLARGPVGVAAKDGRFLWGYEKIANGTGNNYTPLVRGDRVFCASGYGKGMALLKLSAEKDTVRAEEVWYKKVSLPPWHDGTILVGDHVYAGAGKEVLCVELATGAIAWQDRGPVGGAVSMAAAEGNLYLLSQKGEVALVEATSQGCKAMGKFQLPGAAAKPGATAPVIAGGRLYLRDDERVFCYDIRKGAAVKPGKELDPVKPDAGKPAQGGTASPPKAPGEPDAVFVPTPQDVVARMVEAAGIRQGDRVCDLGCGDGRVVATAARRHGCRAVGYDIDPECVRLARDNVRLESLGGLVTVDQRDMFTLDLRDADVVFLYLSPELNERLLPQLEKMRPGSRIVSHAFEMPGVAPDRVVSVPSTEDYLDHKVYVWTTPLKKSQAAK
jgi:outer membrane protein assembly factor BamB